MIAYSYSFQAPFVSHSVIDQHGDLVHTSPITIPRSIFMHDFAATEIHSVLDFPITLDVGRAIAGGPAVDFEPQYGSRIGVMPRYGLDEDVRWFDVETGVVIHTANAQEEGDEVVLQASRSNTADIARTALQKAITFRRIRAGSMSGALTWLPVTSANAL